MNDYDLSIHCNCLDCRKIICHEQKACVTSCSHIFCLECANVKFTQALVCPACEAGLTQTNDIVLVELSPSEEYKSSILAGLSPMVIMDICNRAISFYNYQVSQELCYRKAVQQNLESQLGSKQDRLEAVIRDHKRIVQGEVKKMQALTKENEFEKRRNHDLQNEIQTKSIQFTKLQTMYDKLKQKTTGSMIQQSVQDRMTSVHPVTNDKHQSPYQTTQSPKSFVPPLHRNRQYQPPTTDILRNVMDPEKHGAQPYHWQQMNNNTAGSILSPLYSPHRVPPRNEIGGDHGFAQNQQQQHYRHQDHHHYQQQQHQQQPQLHGWKQFPPPRPPRPPPQPQSQRNYVTSDRPFPLS